MKKPALLLFSLLFSFFSQNHSIAAAQTDVTLEIQMFEGPEYIAMVETAEYWNGKYARKTGISVNVTQLERIGYFGKLETQLMAGLPTPDIVNPFSIHLGKLWRYFQPMNIYLEDPEIMTAPDGESLSLDLMMKSALKTVEDSKGMLYMIPKDMSEVILFYRGDIIEDPPDTWDDFIETARNFTRAINPDSPTEYGAIVQGKYEVWTFCAALEAIWPYGGRIFDKDSGALMLGDERTVKGLEVYEKLAQEGIIPDESINAEHPEVGKLMSGGDIAMALQWNAYYNEIIDEEKASPEIYGKVKIAPPPGVLQDDGSIRRAIYVQTICLAINRYSEHKKEAARFIMWAALGEGAQIYEQAGGSSPVKAVWRSEDSNGLYKKMGPWVDDYGRSLPVRSDISDIAIVGAGWIQMLLAGEVTAEQAASGMYDDVFKIVEK